MHMSRNVGTVDRWVRVLLGLGLLSLVFVGPKTMWGLVGLILVVTAGVSFCPLYAMFGWSTSAPRASSANG
jgi:Inner membrane protein YgaP-like, transmembrane domain